MQTNGLYLQLSNDTIKVNAGGYHWKDVQECNILIPIKSDIETFKIKNNIPTKEIISSKFLKLVWLKDVVSIQEKTLHIHAQSVSREYKLKGYIQDYINVDTGDSAVIANDLLFKQTPDLKEAFINETSEGKTIYGIFDAIKFLQNPSIILINKNNGTPLPEHAKLFRLLKRYSLQELTKDKLKEISSLYNDWENPSEMIEMLQSAYQKNVRFYTDCLYSSFIIGNHMKLSNWLIIRNNIFENVEITIVIPQFININKKEIVNLFINAFKAHIMTKAIYKKSLEKIEFKIIYYNSINYITEKYRITLDKSNFTLLKI